MTRMLVAYDPCGCRLSALFDPDDPSKVKDMKDALGVWGDMVEFHMEEHDRIGAQPCAEHEPK